MRTVCRHQKMDCAFTRPHPYSLVLPLLAALQKGAHKVPLLSLVGSCILLTRRILRPQERAHFASSLSQLRVHTVGTVQVYQLCIAVFQFVHVAWGLSCLMYCKGSLGVTL